MSGDSTPSGRAPNAHGTRVCAGMRVGHLRAPAPCATHAAGRVCAGGHPTFRSMHMYVPHKILRAVSKYDSIIVQNNETEKTTFDIKNSVQRQVTGPIGRAYTCTCRVCKASLVHASRRVRTGRTPYVSIVAHVHFSRKFASKLKI